MENLIWVVKAKHIENFKIHFEFNDGISGIIDLKDHLDKPIFQELKSIEYFKHFQLGSWTIEWPNGADIAPEFLYNLIPEKINHGV